MTTILQSSDGRVYVEHVCNQVLRSTPLDLSIWKVVDNQVVGPPIGCEDCGLLITMPRVLHDA